MKRSILLFLLLSLGVGLPSEGGMFGNPGQSGHPWHFNGREFVPGPGSGAMVVMVRDGYLPVVRTGDDSVPSVTMPDDLGVVAGICYLQVSGGKLANQGGASPSVGHPLEFVGASGMVWHATSDGNGFFVLPLPGGSYDARGTGAPVRVTVTAGKTSLVALRTGKRMVD